MMHVYVCVDVSDVSVYVCQQALLDRVICCQVATSLPLYLSTSPATSQHLLVLRKIARGHLIHA